MRRMMMMSNFTLAERKPYVCKEYSANIFIVKSRPFSGLRVVWYFIANFEPITRD